MRAFLLCLFLALPQAGTAAPCASGDKIVPCGETPLCLRRCSAKIDVWTDRSMPCDKQNWPVERDAIQVRFDVGAAAGEVRVVEVDVDLPLAECPGVMQALPYEPSSLGVVLTIHEVDPKISFDDLSQPIGPVLETISLYPKTSLPESPMTFGLSKKQSVLETRINPCKKYAFEVTLKTRDGKTTGRKRVEIKAPVPCERPEGY